MTGRIRTGRIDLNFKYPMRIFLDTADVPTIIKHYSTGLIDGVTTNPTLIMKSHRKPDDVYQELKNIGLKDISMEVVGHSAAEMVTEGLRLVDLFGECATIKVPCTRDGLQACKELWKKGVRVNVTLIFNSAQAVLAAKAGAAYVSPFEGRLVDNSIHGLECVRYISEIYQKQWIKTEVLAASIRDVFSVTEAFYHGAQVVTMPPSVFEKMYDHVLTDKGVEMFASDWANVLAETTGLPSDTK